MPPLDYLWRQAPSPRTKAQTNSKKQRGAGALTSLLFTCAPVVLVSDAVKWNMMERSALCLRWRRVIRKTNKRVGETASEFFALMQKRDLWASEGTRCLFGTLFTSERYLAVQYSASTSRIPLGRNYKWPCDHASLQAPRDIDPRLIIDSRLLWVTRCTVGGLGIPFRLQMNQAATRGYQVSFQLQRGNNVKE